MALNLELKARVENHEAIKHILKNIGATFEKILDQKDIYYKVEDGLLKLRIENGNYSLIKYNREEEKSDRWSNYYVVKMEGTETELLFSSLFPIETEVVKKRELYLYKDTRIHIDTVE
ncbi:MAG: CYTH domain-containing protein, partial [Melioribacteraceae bacterium]|nr:CYTH domain-containing protein [Melioribacteraceae bacterium]